MDPVESFRKQVNENIKRLGDDKEVLIFDAAHDHQPIIDAVNGRNVKGIVLTHGHNDHINAAVALRDAVDAPIMLHEFDRFLWDVVYPDHDFDAPIEPGRTLRVAGHELAILHPPGHPPGRCCFHDVATRAALTGATLFLGGPGATGRGLSDEPTILASMRDVLLQLPDPTVVPTAHGDTTTIGDERDRVLERVAELELS